MQVGILVLVTLAGLITIVTGAAIAETQFFSRDFENSGLYHREAPRRPSESVATLDADARDYFPDPVWRTQGRFDDTDFREMAS